MMRDVARLRSWKVAIAAFILSGIFTGVTAGQSRDLRAVFTLTNEADGNRLAVFVRDEAGESLAQPYFVPTGGNGTGAGLGNQGALALSDDGRFLFAVNPGSDTITVFDVSQGGVERVQMISSGGEQPISVATHGNLLFVLNAGGAVGFVDSIAGFTIGARGRLHPIPRSERLLSAADTGPAQIGFNSAGTVLAVTEKNTNLITTFTVDAQGNPSAPNSQASAGMEPFGFAFTADGLLVISEASDSTASSYRVDNDGTISVVSASVPTQQTAACWLAVTENGSFAFTANTGSNTISGYAIDASGTLTLLNADGVDATTGGGPLDLAILGNSVLFVLNSAEGSIGVYAIDDSGALNLLQEAYGLPLTGLSGLVVR
jgi:6-phosphogluconolactonase (cycloisomerase 2 family)